MYFNVLYSPYFAINPDHTDNSENGKTTLTPASYSKLAMERPPAKCPRLHLAETITVVAGKEDKSQQFVVHKEFATKSSEYIRAALNREWKEAQEKRIVIPDTEPETLEGYVNWIYSGCVTLADTTSLCGHCKTHKGEHPEIEDTLCNCHCSLELAKMYTLGDYLNDMKFCNAVTDFWSVIAKSTTCVPNPGAVRYVWRNTASDSPVRNFILDQWKELDPEDIGRCLNNKRKIPRAFTVDLLVATGKLLWEPLIYFEDSDDEAEERLKHKCKYHRHLGDTDKCTWMTEV